MVLLWGLIGALEWHHSIGLPWVTSLLALLVIDFDLSLVKIIIIGVLHNIYLLWNRSLVWGGVEKD